MSSIEELRIQHQHVGDAIEAVARGESGAATHLEVATNRLRAAAETPATKIVRQPYHTVQNLALIMAMQMGLLSILSHRKEDVLSASELARITEFDCSFVARVMRMVTATGYADEIAYQEYRANAVTLLNEQPGGRSTWAYTNDWFFALGSKYKDYVHSMKGGKAVEEHTIPFVFGNEKTVWQYLQERPEELQDFNENMTLREKLYMVPWHLKYPLFERLESKRDYSDITIVDVGGGRGHDLSRVIQDRPDFSGRLILQDRPATIAAARESLHPRIEPIEHNFFQTQPVKGADIYHIKGCLHNWRDAQCITIVSKIAEAMSTDSRLLINDLVLADVGETTVNRVDMDIEMLFVNGSIERDERQWRALLDQVQPRIRVEKIWSAAGDDQSTIEVALM